MPGDPEIIEAADVQGLVLWGYGRLPHAAFSFRQIVDEVEFRSWLHGMLDHVTHADMRGSPRGEAFNIAFTASGLALLLAGGPSLARRGFSEEFIEGMASRAAELGDAGYPTPDPWDWHDDEHGNGSRRVDLVLLYYWEDPKQSGPNPPVAPSWATEAWDPSNAVAEGGMLEVWRERTETMKTEDGRVKEHFGFTDGLGNPAIRGWRRSGSGKPVEGNVVEPGEFILGYPDQDDASHFMPPLEREAVGPREDAVTHSADLVDFDSMAVDSDTLDVDLSDATESSTAVAPSGTLRLARSVDAFLRNGSYMVVRKLKQDVPGFLQFAWAHAEPYQPDAVARAKDTVTMASKMLGRWPNGASLTVARDFKDMLGFSSASPQDLEDFSYAEDSGGVGCPFGAHVRRVNPRDTTFVHSPISAEGRVHLVNRRRLMRRGRSYGSDPFPNKTLTSLLFPNGPDEPPVVDLHGALQPSGPEGRGLLFVCFNADIVRQFEHVQRTWINNPFFGGLQEDPDPVVGTGPTKALPEASFTIPTVQGRRRLRGLGQYVTTRAGAYFFMPGVKSLRALARPIAHGGGG